MSSKLVRKLALPSVLSAVFAVIGLGLSAYSMNSLRTNGPSLKSTAYETKLLVSTTENLIQLKDDLIDGIPGNDAEVDVILHNLNNYREELFFVEFLDPSLKGRLTQISESIGKIHDVYSAKKVFTPADVDHVNRDIMTLVRNIGFTLRLATESSYQKYDTSIRVAEYSILITLILIILTVLYAFIVTDQIYKVISRDINALRRWARKIADGTIDHRGEVFEYEEFGVISKIFHQIENNIVATLAPIRNETKNLPVESTTLEKFSFELSESLSDLEGHFERITYQLTLCHSRLSAVVSDVRISKGEKPGLTHEELTNLSSEMMSMLMLTLEYVRLAKDQSKFSSGQVAEVLDVAHHIEIANNNIIQCISQYRLIKKD